MSNATTRATGRQTYRKGLETSFGRTNLTAVGSYFVKRQDGNEIEPSQVAEINQMVSQVQMVLGDLTPLFRKVGMVVSHTNGTHPFLRQAGGVYSPDTQVITIGVKMKHSGRVIKAFGPEFAHLLDDEAGTMLYGAEGTVVWNHSGKSPKRIVSLTAHQYNYHRRQTSSDKASFEFIRHATREMQQARMARSWLRRNGAKSEQEKTHAETIRFLGGAYWTSPHEVFARLTEQYLSRQLQLLKQFPPEDLVAVESGYQHLPVYWGDAVFAEMEARVEAMLRERIEIILNHKGDK